MYGHMTKKNHTAVRSQTGSAGTGSANIEMSPIHLLHRAGQCAGEIFQTEMDVGDLTPRQFAVLVSISENEGLSQTNLVKRTGIDRSTLADIVRRMLKKGLVQRRRTKEDARAYSVRLTEAGRRVLDSAVPIASRVDKRILSVLSDRDRDRFLVHLSAIVEQLSVLGKSRRDDNISEMLKTG